MEYKIFTLSSSPRNPWPIQLMHNAPGLVIDIRGNPGGDSKVGIALAEQLVKDST
jgi:C-terminal processing protease CtpA/Prc